MLLLMVCVVETVSVMVTPPAALNVIVPAPLNVKAAALDESKISRAIEIGEATLIVVVPPPRPANAAVVRLPGATPLLQLLFVPHELPPAPVHVGPSV